MKYLLPLLLLLTGCGGNSTRFAIVIASYNNEKYCEENLKSVFDQKYKNYHIVYVNDMSSDETFKRVEKSLKAWGHPDRYTLINNSERMGACANYFNAIHNHVADDEVVVILDGDDKLSGPKTLSHLNKVYRKGNIWLTYGQFRDMIGGAHGFCTPIPEEYVRRNAFREYEHLPSHLRSFKGWLFKRIKKEDLMYEGKFLDMSWDVASMMPMIEMARDHYEFIPKVLYSYNNNNVISDHRISQKRQRKIDLYIREQPRYQPLREKP